MMKLLSFTVFFLFLSANAAFNQALARVESEPQSILEFKKARAKLKTTSKQPKSQEPVPRLEVSVIHQGFSDQNYDLSVKSLMVLTSLDSYERELYKHSAEQAQDVDFTRQQILLIDSGNQPNSAHYLSVTAISEYNDYVEVTVTLTLENQQDDCFYPSAIVHPYRFYTLDSKKRVLFKEQLQVAEPCSG